ncbi:MAG TPA: NUDIX hydrolase [Thermohalobaculum sp.]|nr:NUDIX hydrolase [Thermohalobaculum sp.]
MSDGVRDFLRQALGRSPRDGAERQYGAIPWRRSAGGVEFLLVTSRRTRRWIFPKGGRMAWLSPQATAQQEAFEEAGVEGNIAEHPAGLYRSTKRRESGDIEIEVEMFPLEVTVELEDWPEKRQRTRQWVGADEACAMISEPELLPMIRAVAAA